MSRKTRAPRTPSPADKAFGRHLRSCRRARGLTQERLAELADVSSDTIRRLEYGSFSPSLDTMRKIAKGMQIELSTLFAAYEVGERDLRREVVDAVTGMSDEDRELALRIIGVLRLLAGED